jgi:acetyl esterase/lipase
MNPLVLSTCVLLFFPAAPGESADAREANDALPASVVLERDLPYRNGDNRQWRLDLARPAEPAKGLRPAIVVIHGGGWLEGDKSSFSTPARRPPGNIIDLARRGYVAITINYRLSAEAAFPAAIDDCRTAVRWLRAHARHYGVDRNRIGAWGNSAGGHLALLLALDEAAAVADRGAPHAEFSSRVQCAVSDSGPLDLEHQSKHGDIRTVVERFLGGPAEGDRLPLYRKASPIHHATKEAPPLLLIHGTADSQVSVETADAFVVSLSRAGARDVGYLRLSAAGHCPHSLVRVPWVDQAVNEFYDRVLRRTD